MTQVIYQRGFSYWLRRFAAAVMNVISMVQRSGESAQEDVNAQAARILDSYGNSVLRLAYSYLHNMPDAEDILQETLIRYFRSAPQFESDSHEKAWLLRVAANLSKNRIDYNKIRLSEELNEEIGLTKRTTFHSSGRL